MATPFRPHPSHTPPEHDLLRTLLDAPPDRAPASLAPASLRSVEVQRDHALRGFLRRTWIDRGLRHAEGILMLAALTIFGYWVYDGPIRDWMYVQQQPAAVSAAPAQRSLAARLPSISSTNQVPLPLDEEMTPRRVGPPAPVATSPQPTRLIAPSIGLDTPVNEMFVVDGVWQVAEYAAGYLNGTALPGDPGNTALAGHAGLRGGVFRDLGQLQPGDEILLDAGGWRFRYRVRSMETVWPTQVEVLDPTPTQVLTLLTCTNWDTQRLVVVADLLDSRPTPGA